MKIVRFYPLVDAFYQLLSPIQKVKFVFQYPFASFKARTKRQYLMLLLKDNSQFELKITSSVEMKRNE